MSISGVSKNIFNNKAINYANGFLSFSNVSRRARQHINPRWAQSIAATYRDAFNFRNSHKLVCQRSIVFSGFRS